MKIKNTILIILCVFGLQFGFMSIAQAKDISINIHTIESVDNELKYVTDKGQICVYKWSRNENDTMPQLDGVYHQNVVALSKSVGGIAYFIKEDGTLWKYDTDNINNASIVEDVSNCIKVCTGYEHTLALLEDGTVYAWGRNDEGQLGNGTYEYSEKPQKVLKLSNIIDISTGDYFSMALDSNGNIFTWGSNFTGELGNGTYTDIYNNINNNSNVPIKVEGLERCIQISSGHQLAAALTVEGTVYSWGDGLVMNPTANAVYPTLIKDIGKCIQIDAKEYCLLALSENGEVWQRGAIDLSVDGGLKGPCKITGVKNVNKIIAGVTDVFLLSDGTLWQGEFDEKYIQNMKASCLLDENNDLSKKTTGTIVLAEEFSPIDKLFKYNVTSIDEKKLDGFVTRYECVDMVLQLCGFGEEQCGKYFTNRMYSTPIWSDLLEKNVCHFHLEFARNKGIVYGVTDDLFEPTRYATYQEAIAFAMRINGNKKCSRDAALDVMLDEALRTNTIDKAMYDKKNDNITYEDWCKILINILDTECIIDAGTEIDYANLTYRQLLEKLIEQEG